MTGGPPRRVRPAAVADAAAMATLRARSWRSTYTGLLPDAVIEAVVGSEADWAARLAGRIADPSSPDDFLVIEEPGRVSGIAIWGPSGDADATPTTAQVRAIYLDPDAIGRGLGRELFGAVVSEIARRGFRSATLWVLDTNARARRFYEVAGWHVDGATKTDQRPGGVLHEVRYRYALTWSTPPEVNPEGVVLEEGPGDPTPRAPV